ncbi:hypothetical protein J3R83DRAFT_7257 [Lanmaoa asiatica]|nr:hypothetical protein J3R83DRAFT_7257 [Lanmaoa asiatica]
MLLPLGRRLEVSIDEPSEFILGAIQLLVNRDRRGCADRSRQLGPQLIENYVDINRWATEYFRSRHGTHVVDSDVPTLLTISSLLLRTCVLAAEAVLGVKDFAFGFDFKMSQDLPFYVETSSQIREPPPICTVEVQSTSQPVTTNSGRQVKPTKRAQAASEQAQTNASGRRNKGKNTSQVKDKRAANGSAPAARQKKNPPQPSSGRTVQKAPLPSQAKSHVAAYVPPKTTSEHTKHRLTRSSNLGLPPILPGSSSTPGKTPSQSDDSSKSRLSTSALADTLKASGPSGPNPTVDPPPRLKITLPARSSPASTVPATRLTSSNTNGSTPQQITQANTLETTNRGRGASRSGGTKPRGPRNWRGRGCERGNGSRTKTPTPEAAPDKTKVLPTAHPVTASNAVASATVNLAVAPPVYALRSAVCTTSRARPHGADNSIGTRNSRRLTSQNMRTGQSRPPATDPGHPQGKKRKLDDCED